MTDDAKLLEWAKKIVQLVWDEVGPDGYIEPSDRVRCANEILTFLADARREALMEAAYIATGHSRERIEEHIRALADAEGDK